MFDGTPSDDRPEIGRIRDKHVLFRPPGLGYWVTADRLHLREEAAAN